MLAFLVSYRIFWSGKGRLDSTTYDSPIIEPYGLFCMIRHALFSCMICPRCRDNRWHLE